MSLTILLVVLTHSDKIYKIPWARKVIQLTVYTCWPRPGGPGDLASPAGTAGCLPSDGPPGNAAVSVEHHYLAGSHRQLACQTQEQSTSH